MNTANVRAHVGNKIPSYLPHKLFLGVSRTPVVGEGKTTATTRKHNVHMQRDYRAASFIPLYPASRPVRLHFLARQLSRERPLTKFPFLPLKTFSRCRSLHLEPNLISPLRLSASSSFSISRKATLLYRESNFAATDRAMASRRSEPRTFARLSEFIGINDKMHRRRTRKLGKPATPTKTNGK